MLDTIIKKLFGRESAGNEWEKLDSPVIMEPVRLAQEDNGDIYYKISFATDKGLVRDKNEDSFFIDSKFRHTFEQNESDCYIELTQDTHIFGLFDGMGGEAYGDTASELAAVSLEKMSDSLRSSSSSDLPFYMNEFARTANSAIIDMLLDHNSERGGSTFTALCIKNGTAYPFYLGDSRIYLYDESGLLQITEDQTLAMRKIKSGEYTEEEAKNSPDHHKLTCYLGADRADIGLDAQPCMPVPLKDGTKLLMCSDGLSDMCSREEISEILGRGGDNPAQELVDKAVANGGADNVTCVVIETGVGLV